MSGRCDLLIRNGLVFDGFTSGKKLDIAVSNGRIVALGSCLDLPTDNLVDAQGLWIAPGFVDIHTHYDLEVELQPSLSESVRHGVTSVVMGNCSLSTTYGAPEDLGDIFSRVETLPAELIAQWLKKAQERSCAQEYFQFLDDLPLGANVASLLGHSALRVKVMGLKRSLHEHASKAELKVMRKLAEEALDAGCIGISIDMVHWHKVNGTFSGRALPSHHADFCEYAMLADVCRSRDAVFQVTPNPRSSWSFISLAQLSLGLWRAPLRITILAALDMDVAPQLWRLYSPLLYLFNNLLGCNIRFQTLAEPFTIHCNGCLTPIFEEFAGGVKLNNCKTRQQRQDLWQDASFRQEFEESWNGNEPRAFHRDFERMFIVSAPNAQLAGKTIAQSAREAGEAPLKHFMTLLEVYDQALRWTACSANTRDEIRRRLMKHPHILPGFSDAGAHSRNIAFFDGTLSVLREAVNSGFMPIEKAIARVTSEPASWFNLSCGTIQPGARADLVLLDPVRLRNPVPEPVSASDPIFAGAPRMVKRDPDPAVRHVFLKGEELVRHGAPLMVPEKSQMGMVLTQENPAASRHEALKRSRNRVNEQWVLAGDVDYWQIFLLKHQHPTNVAFHCLGFLLMYLIPLSALLSGNYWILLLAPLSQLTGRIGHWLYEDSHIDALDSIFSWRAFRSLHHMFILVLLGRYGDEVRRALRTYGACPSDEAVSSDSRSRRDACAPGDDTSSDEAACTSKGSDRSPVLHSSR